MGITLPNSLKSQVERPQGTDPALWLVELELARGSVSLPPVLLRICDGPVEIEWPLPPDPVPEGWTSTLWRPFPFAFTPFEETQEGDLTSVDFTVDNCARTLMRFLHEAEGLEGNRATLFLVQKAGLSIPHPDHEFRRYDLEVQLAGANDEAVTFRLGMPNWFAITSPTERYIPKRCGNDFGSADCGYVRNAFAAFDRCPKTIAACAERGEDMRARGLPDILPGNYRGHPGIGTQR
jgi:hypothetical protein